MNEDIRYFETNGKEFFPLAPNDRVAWSYEPKSHITHEVLVMKFYPKDLHISDRNKTTRSATAEIKAKLRGKRSIIKKFSFGATRRCKFVFKNIVDQMNVIVHLTYPKKFPMDGSIVKKHLHGFLDWLNKRGYKNAWVLEFQDRGAPHFHIMIDKKIPWQDVAERWYKIVDSKDPKHLEAGTKVEAIRSKGGMAVYMVGYLNKNEQKIVPDEYKKVGRFWGYSKGLLKKKEIRIYGSVESIKMIKEKLKFAKAYNKAQKKIWDRKDKKMGRKNKVKKFYHQYSKGIYSLRLTNADKYLSEIEKRGMDTFPFSLLAIPAVPPRAFESPWRDGEAKKDDKHNLPLGLSTKSYRRKDD
jgi:hypothetical protein